MFQRPHGLSGMLKKLHAGMSHHGFSLVEMMVATLIGMMLLTGITFIFTHTVKANTETLKSAHLHQELRAIMDILIQDIRRSGYWSKAVCSVNPNILFPDTVAEYCAGEAGQQNPFDVMAISEDKDCILYNYDATPNGILDTVPNKNDIPDERFGFRLNAGAVEMRQAGADCDTGGWQDVSDPRSITITRLEFNSGNSNSVNIHTNVGRIITREINIVLEGRLKHDPAIVRTIISGVRVRNDRFCPSTGQCQGI